MTRPGFLDYLFGYYQFEIPKNRQSRVAFRLHKAGIYAKLVEGKPLVVRSYSVWKYRKILDGIDGVICSPLIGLPETIIKNRNKIGLILAVLTTVFFAALLSGRVLDVRISDDAFSKNGEVEKALSDVGLSSGMRFSEIDFEKVESAFLSRSDSFGWIHLNRRGGVVYVELGERHPTGSPTSREPANVLSTEDAVVTRVTVTEGEAAVKPGDPVLAGDLLISGIRPAASGGGFCHASGEIYGEVRATLTVTVPRKERILIPKDRKLLNLSLNFLNFSVNILKNHSKTDSDCAIIEENKRLTFPGGVSLPLSVTQTSACFYDVSEVTLTDEAMLSRASARMRELIGLCLSDGELSALRTSGTFTEDGYVMTTEIVVERQIGRQRPLSFGE